MSIRSLYSVAASLLVAAATVSVSGCGGDTATDTSGRQATTTTATTLREPGNAARERAESYVVPAGTSAPSDLVALAIDAYLEAEAEGVDLDDGPCLGIVADGWVADVAHAPRQRVDDERANQCDAFHSGEAPNFIELDVDGTPLNVNGLPIEEA